MNDKLLNKIERTINKFLTQKHNIIEEEITQKRMRWFNANYKHKKPRTIPTPRETFDMFFFDYLNLDPEELPVLFESENRIEWLSKNKCSTLEACLKANLDTRFICRAIFEKSTQALFSKLDPQLRFFRDYKEIRPYSQHCRESIIRIQFEKYMSQAIDEAEISKEEGNKGYGALVLFGETVLSRKHDTAITEKDPSKHAEVNALREAVKVLGDENLCGAILFTTCEPCPMCTSLAIWTNISAIVYGISIKDTIQLGRTRINMPSAEIIKKSPVSIEIIGDVLREKCKELYV